MPAAMIQYLLMGMMFVKLMSDSKKNKLLQEQNKLLNDSIDNFNKFRNVFRDIFDGAEVYTKEESEK